MTVEPCRFVEAMTDHWQTSLGNTASDNLRAVWSQMAHTFNRQIAAQGTAEGQQWKVLQPATGTGKSQGLAVYCSLLPPDEESHPGVLIVTRLKEQANELMETINRLSGRDVALAYHSDSKHSRDVVTQCPVLIITHKAYEIGLDAVNQGRTDKSNWSLFMAWRGDDSRKLVVVDEALDIIEEAQVTFDDVSYVLGALPYEVRQRFPEQIAVAETLRDVLSQIAKAQRETPELGKEKVLWKGEVPLPESYDMTPLRQALKDIRFDLKAVRRDDRQLNAQMGKRCDEILKGVHMMLDNWNWYAKRVGDHTLNAARLIVPDDAPGAVVLDATATSNLIYRLFEHRADVLRPPTQARRYDNVTLHVSRGHRVGKVAMQEHGKEEAAQLIANLQTRLGADRKIFVCTHKFVEPHLASLETGFRDYDVGHWGAIDGRNEWSRFDAAVIFGLPYRPATWSANIIMALQGLQTTEWLQSEGDRPFKEFRDIRHSLKVGQLVVSIVQAINRVQCRRVIDAQGNCSPTDVFILLPRGREADEILEGIVTEMPGIKVVDWEYSRVKRKSKPSKHKEGLIRYANVMSAGRKAATQVRKELSASPATWDRIASELKDAASELAQRLMAVGVRYEVVPAGKTRRAYLVKEPN